MTSKNFMILLRRSNLCHGNSTKIAREKCLLHLNLINSLATLPKCLLGRFHVVRVPPYSSNQASAFSSNVPNRGNIQRNQTSNNGPRPNNMNNSKQNEGYGLVCEHNGFNGYNINKCFKLIGYLADFGKKKFGQNFKNKNVSNNNSVGFSSSSSFTDEQLSTLIYLIKDNSLNGKNIQATWQVGHPNRTEAFISKIRNLKLSNGLVLYGVLVIPEYRVTLMLFSIESIFAFKVSFTEKAGTTSNVFQNLNHINIFDVEYHETANDDEKVDLSLNSDQRSQSDNRHSFVPGGDVNTIDFPNDNSRNDAQSSDDIFAP
ncbi:hypothetical protein Tco_1056390 [Tanacetum coccineum]|uniref:Uncharacterized protein n=1 Tax=Tanacetum coccineum TaxID=301880 RepID=A0ABQ5H2D3_9ASTR